MCISQRLGFALALILGTFACQDTPDDAEAGGGGGKADDPESAPLAFKSYDVVFTAYTPITSQSVAGTTSDPRPPSGRRRSPPDSDFVSRSAM